ncbi:unnamed protein product [Gordionus sp. m RMFG-2023]
MYEGGLAAGTETALSESEKLAVVHLAVKGKTDVADSFVPYRRFNSMVNYAVYDIVKHTSFATMSRIDKKILLGSVYVCFSCKLICYKGETTVPDGDWRIVTRTKMAAYTNEENSIIAESMSKENLQLCVVLISAAKVNFYKENHHTGQGSTAGYIRKVMRAKIGEQYEPKTVHVIHRVSHWASTRQVLTQLGLQHVALSTPLLNTGRETGITPTADLSLRINSNPAGTARHFVAHAFFRCLVAELTVQHAADLAA